MFPFISALSAKDAEGTPIDPPIPIFKRLRMRGPATGLEGLRTTVPATDTETAPQVPGADADEPRSVPGGHIGSSSAHPGATSSTSFSREKIMIDQLLSKFGKTFCNELGIELERGDKDVLWQWFCGAILFSTRIKSGAGTRACKALIAKGLGTPEAMSQITGDRCQQILRESGYDRYEEKAASFLIDGARQLLSEYQGDFNCLRQMSGCSPDKERALLKKFRGVGDGGVDIFFREVQIVWGELQPFADRKALKAARLLQIRSPPKELFQLCDSDGPTYVRLISALVRVELFKAYNNI